MILNSGIKKVIYKNGYPDKFALELFAASGVELVKFENL
jgi:dCMP deaminase